LTSTATTTNLPPAGLTIEAASRPTGAPTMVAWLVAGIAALLPIAISSQENSPPFTLKYALMLILAALGTVPLVKLAVRSRYEWQARAAIAFVVVGAISAIVSPSPLIGFFGLYDWGEGVIFFLAFGSAWALGVTLDAVGREWLLRGLLIGITANAIAAVAQVVFNLSTPSADLSGFGLFDGTQADGMMGNPIHLEALLVGGLALILGRACRGRWPWLVLVALFGAALEFSSERWGVILLALLVCYAVWAYRVKALRFIVASAAGFLVAIASGVGETLSHRVATSSTSATYGLRVGAWVTSVKATLLHAPLLGFGPGEARNSILRYQSASFLRQLAVGKDFTDMHDLFVNVLVMTGLLGFALFIAFCAGSLWGVRGAFAGFAVLAVGAELVDPMNVAVTPLAFLALGAALTASRGDPFEPVRDRLATRPRWRLQVAVGCVALVPAIVLVIGDAYEHSASQHFSLSDAKLANALAPIWPQSADEVAQLYAYESVVDPSTRAADLALSVDWAADAASRDPSDPSSWALLAQADMELSRYGPARVAINKALRDEPLYVPGLEVSGELYVTAGEWPKAASAFREALSIQHGDPTLESDLSNAEAHEAATTVRPG
jgi:tetratricopeptide (TPR) repeat protein